MQVILTVKEAKEKGIWPRLCEELEKTLDPFNPEDFSEEHEFTLSMELLRSVLFTEAEVMDRLMGRADSVTEINLMEVANSARQYNGALY